MKRLFIAIFVLFLGSIAFGMDAPMSDVGKKRPASALEESDIELAESALEKQPEAKEGRLETKEERQEWIAAEKRLEAERAVSKEKTALLQEYPPDIEERIRKFLLSVPGMGPDKLYNVARDIRARRLISKAERDKIDDPKFMDALIRQLAREYASNDMVKVVYTLHTKAAADWLNNQLLRAERISVPYLKGQVTLSIIYNLLHNYPDVARFLLNAAKVPNEPRYLLNFTIADIEGHNLLIAVARIGNQYIFDRIFPFYSGQINAEATRGTSALFEAIANGNTQIALALLQAGANPLERDEDTNELNDSALLYATEANNTQVVHALLANPEIRRHINFISDSNQLRPLAWAAENNNYPMFKEILDVPNVRLGRRILYFAMRNNTQMVADLVRNNTPMNTSFSMGDRETFPAFGVFEDEDNVPVVDDTTTRDRLALLLPRLRVNNLEEGDKSLLMHAVEQAKSKTVELLLNAGAEVDIQDLDGHDALWYAQQLTSHNKERIIKMLKDALAAKQKGGKI